MRSTFLLVTVSIITGLAIGYLLGGRKSADLLKCCRSEKKDDLKEVKTQPSPDTDSL